MYRNGLNSQLLLVFFQIGILRSLSFYSPHCCIPGSPADRKMLPSRDLHFWGYLFSWPFLSYLFFWLQTDCHSEIWHSKTLTPNCGSLLVESTSNSNYLIVNGVNLVSSSMFDVLFCIAGHIFWGSFVTKVIFFSFNFNFNLGLFFFKIFFSIATFFDKILSFHHGCFFCNIRNWFSDKFLVELLFVGALLEEHRSIDG